MTMKTMRSAGWIAAMALVAVSAPIEAQTAEDRAGVERAALDYLEGFYEGSTEKIRRGVHPDVLKFGFAMRDGEWKIVQVLWQSPPSE